MGFHCDNTYSLSGKYLECSNSQIENTPIVIVSFGNDRVLHWEKLNYKKSSKGKMEWVKDFSFMKKMIMDENNIVIVNCSDEIPHPHYLCGSTCKYRHGNVSVNQYDKMSFSLVFRVVQKYADYNVHNDTMISTICNQNAKQNDMFKTRTNMYDSTELQQYHELLKKCYLNMRMKY